MHLWLPFMAFVSMMVYQRGMLNLRIALVALGIAAVPLLALPQGLPQSTLDRQQIQNLQFQAGLPGTTPEDRAQIQREITQLQYQINTRPLIEPMPTITPGWNSAALVNGQLPALSANPTIAPTSATIYGSCAADRQVITYLTQQIQLPSVGLQERVYDESQRKQLIKEVSTSC